MPHPKFKHKSLTLWLGTLLLTILLLAGCGSGANFGHHNERSAECQC